MADEKSASRTITLNRGSSHRVGQPRRHIKRIITTYQRRVYLYIQHDTYNMAGLLKNVTNSIWHAFMSLHQESEGMVNKSKLKVGKRDERFDYNI